VEGFDLDVNGLLDKLENLVASSGRIPLTAKVLVDEDAIYEIIDDIRASLPEELKQAKIIAKERERLVEEARRESEQVIAEAKLKASKLAEESYVVEEARVKAQEIIEKAKGISQEIVDGAKGYADDLLADVLANVEKIVAGVQKGREELKRSRSGREDPTTASNDESF
jgi:cell division septum initiation protein DivIVA